MKRYIIGLTAVILLSLFTLRPIFYEGFFSMHDDTQVGRVVAMGKAIRNGQFPVRWVSDLGFGYGYPIFNFYGPLPYYAGGAVYALGASGLTATKVMMGIGIIAAGLGMFLLTKPVFGMTGALLSSVLYLYAPYHAVQIYVRGAVGEFWAYAFVPLILLGLLKKNPLLMGLGIFAVVTSHTIMGYVSVLALTASLLLGTGAPRKATGFGLVYGLLLSAFFWLPAVFEKSYTSIDSQIGPTAAYWDHYVCLGQLWNSLWGFAGTAVGCIDGMSFRLGKPHIILALAGIVLYLRTRITKTQTLPSLVPWAFYLGIISLYLMLEVSFPVWKVIPNAAYMQYPWRLLLFSALSLSILGGSIPKYFKNTGLRIAIMVVFVLGLIAVYAKLFMPQTFISANAQSYETEEELRFRVSQVSHEYLPEDLIRPKNSTEIIRDTIEQRPEYSLKTLRETETYGMYRFVSDDEQVVTIHKAYFPGWTYIINSQTVTPVITSGLPQVIIPEGESTLEIRFRNTWVRIVGNVLSMASWTFLFWYYGKNKKIIA